MKSQNSHLARSKCLKKYELMRVLNMRHVEKHEKYLGILQLWDGKKRRKCLGLFLTKI